MRHWSPVGGSALATRQAWERAQAGQVVATTTAASPGSRWGSATASQAQPPHHSVRAPITEEPERYGRERVRHHDPLAGGVEHQVAVAWSAASAASTSPASATSAAASSSTDGARPVSLGTNDRYERPDWVRRLNAMGPAAGGARRMVPLDAGAMIDDARASTGVADPGRPGRRRLGGPAPGAGGGGQRRRPARRGPAHDPRGAAPGPAHPVPARRAGGAATPASPTR